ncbi:MAG: plastocyanin/azurin family copper-binding protein [Thermoplasmata archaeon]
MADEVSPKDGGPFKTVIAMSVVALIVSIVAIGMSFLAPASPAPATQEFTIIQNEREIIGCVNQTTGSVVVEDIDPDCEEEIVGEYHAWEPAVIVVNKGDTVVLTIKNAMDHNHGLMIPAFAVDTGKILGRLDNPPIGSEITVTFVADESGVFQYMCSVPHEHGTNDCAEDHNSIVGYLIVLG